MCMMTPTDNEHGQTTHPSQILAFITKRKRSSYGILLELVAASLECFEGSNL